LLDLIILGILQLLVLNQQSAYSIATLHYAKQSSHAWLAHFENRRMQEVLPRHLKLVKIVSRAR
jgi:hypothetical protein